MEMITVSPPPALPTEAEDPCEIDATIVAIHSVTLLVSLSGLVGNGVVIWFLRLKFYASTIFYLAVIDFLFLFITVPSAVLFLWEDMSCSTILPPAYFSFLSGLSMVPCYWAAWRLTYSSIVTDMENLYRSYCRSRLPKCLLWVVDRVQFWGLLPLLVISVMTSLCPSDKEEHCQVAFISMTAVIVLIFAAPPIISYTINFIKDKHGPQQPQSDRHDTDIVLILLFTILLFLCNFLQEFSYIAVPSQVFFLLHCINSTIKPFIYFLLGRCWRNCSVASLRDSLQRAFEEPEKDTACSNDATTDTEL